jgi:hypothetical protein
MAAVQNPSVTLLDLANRYSHFEQHYDARYFARFSDRNRCVLQLLSSRPILNLLRFFIPDAEHTLISTRILFKSTIFYLYCTDEAAVTRMKQTRDYPMFVKIFLAESLATHLRHAAIDYLVEYADRNKHNPAEHNEALHEAADHANILAQELHNHMVETTGVQPEELR